MMQNSEPFCQVTCSAWAWHTFKRSHIGSSPSGTVAGEGAVEDSTLATGTPSSYGASSGRTAPEPFPRDACKRVPTLVRPLRNPRVCRRHTHRLFLDLISCACYSWYRALYIRVLLQLRASNKMKRHQRGMGILSHIRLWRIEHSPVSKTRRGEESP